MEWYASEESLNNFAVDLPAAPFDGSGTVMVAVETERAQLCAALSMDADAYDEDIEDELAVRDCVVADAATVIPAEQLRALAYVQEQGDRLHRAIVDALREHHAERVGLRRRRGAGERGDVPAYDLRSLWIPRSQPSAGPRWIAVVEPEGDEHLLVWAFEGAQRIDCSWTWSEMRRAMDPLR